MKKNNSAKKTIAIIFGGKSAEHEVSINSAKNIIEALDKEKYEPILVKIEKNGEWKYLESLDRENSVNNLIPYDRSGEFSVFTDKKRIDIDVVFPVLHGPFGEDGTIQGLLKLAKVAFVGADVLGSAIGMDKDVMKRLLREGGLPVGDFLVFKYGEKLNFEEIINKLGSKIFVKPANLGSSVGISKVDKKENLKPAIDLAFSYDNKIIIEKLIEGREIECSVLGNENSKASRCGEIIPKSNFYSYKSKYTDGGADLFIPANIDSEIENKIQSLAIKTYQTLECSGMARVDFFLTKENLVFVNEINTIPGFTSYSMYPKLWGLDGLKYSDLINELIKLAEERFKKERRLRTDKF